MEYYEAIGNERYLIFQNKMKSLWTRPNVINAMSLTNQ
jgi:hypothetical protein